MSVALSAQEMGRQGGKRREKDKTKYETLVHGYMYIWRKKRIPIALNLVTSVLKPHKFLLSSPAGQNLKRTSNTYST